ncbi:MAG: 5'-nucleotidase C-terminal domain-containing protein [Actinobacteria bacterium]|nr:5'-nucleotidase C-terminal domain-containing protein [Actinomycetota bacterium]
MKGEEWIGLLNSSRRRCSHGSEAGLTFKSIPEEGQKWAAVLKNQEKVDVIVATVHSGLETDPTTGKLYEGQTPVLDLAKPYHDETQAWLSSPIGNATGDFLGGDQLRLKDTALIDLINKVQLYYTGADLSVAAAFTTDPQIQKGPVTVRQMFSVYIYDNTLYAIEVTGQQIKDALEHSAKFYNTYDFGAANTPLVNPNIRGYNYDMLAGASYKIDVSSRQQLGPYPGLPLRR